MSKLPTFSDPNLIVGFDTADDAAVYKASDELAIIETVDLFPPIVDDPYEFGLIAAANALSDVYAMGGTPKVAMNILAIPEDIDPDVTYKILKGGADKCIEAGAVLCGGHTIKDKEPKYGLSVTGFVHPDKIKANSSAKAGHVLILTKPIGTGILTTAAKADLLMEDTKKALLKNMITLNKEACEKMLKYDVSSVTDVTGFGLLGHTLEMAKGSNVTIILASKNVPLLPETLDLARDGIVPAGAYGNREYASCSISFNKDVPLEIQDILFDPQTSGGLLIAMDKEDAEKYIKDFPDGKIIGEVIPKHGKSIHVK